MDLEEGMWVRLKTLEAIENDPEFVKNARGGYTNIRLGCNSISLSEILMLGKEFQIHHIDDCEIYFIGHDGYFFEDVIEEVT